MKRTLFVFLAHSSVAACLCLAACEPQSTRQSPAVVATTTMLGDVAATLLKDTGVPVETLIKPGVDPHTYELKANEAKRLQSARFVVYNGLGLEGTMGQMLRGLPDAIEAGAMVPEDRRIGAERVDVVTEGEYVSQGAPVRVVRSEGYRHVVMPVAR